MMTTVWIIMGKVFFGCIVFSVLTIVFIVRTQKKMDSFYAERQAERAASKENNNEPQRRL